MQQTQNSLKDKLGHAGRSAGLERCRLFGIFALLAASQSAGCVYVEDGEYATKAESGWQYHSVLLDADDVYIGVTHLSSMNAFTKLSIEVVTDDPQRVVVGAESFSVGLFDSNGNEILAGMLSTPKRPAMTVEQVTQSIQSGNEKRLVHIIGYSRGNAGHETLQFLLDLWNQREDLYPNLDWALLDRESVRVALAAALLDARGRQGFAVPSESIHEQLRSSALNSTDEAVQDQAALALMRLGDPDDLGLFLHLVSSTNEQAFRRATLGLIHLCSSDADRALFDVAKTLPHDRLLYVKEKYELLADHCRCRREDCSLPIYQFQENPRGFVFRQLFKFPPVHRLPDPVIEKIRIDIQIDGKPTRLDYSFQVSEQHRLTCCLVPGLP